MVQIDELKIKSQIETNAPEKANWKMATEEDKINYLSTLKNLLHQNNSTLACTSCQLPNCSERNHKSECDNLLESIVTSIEFATRTCIPHSGGKKPKNKKEVIPKWNEEIQSYKDKSLFWHSVWESAGKPINTELHHIMKRTRNVYHFQIRKWKRMLNIMKRNALLQACLGDNKTDIFKVIKKMRKCNMVSSSTIDGRTEDIGDHFAGIYKSLFNSVHDETELMHIESLISKRITDESMIDVQKLTPEVVAEALLHLKNDKTDPVSKYTSDSLKIASDILSGPICQLFRSYLIHGYISNILLISTLVPLLKDKLGDVCSSSNYRSIAISSLLLKLFDWVVIILFGDKLNLDEKQFSYQPRISTNMCTWMVSETIDYYSRNGSDVYMCAMDMSKAFDRVKHSTLFKKLLQRDLPDIYIRLLLVMYRQQVANVKWNGEYSETFNLLNGVKQGAVLSAILFCVYMNDLYILLKKGRSGCWINKEFYGIMGYSDDILLLAPTVDALDDMLKTCESYASKHNLQFSTNPNPSRSKTKCVAFRKKNKNKDDPRKLVLCDNELPWVDKVKHLGSIVTNSSDALADDVMQKRAAYINRNNELCQEFFFAHPDSKVNINNIFNTSFYGSMLWNLFGTEAERIEKTWNVSIRKMLNVPRDAHRFFIEPLSKTRHVSFSLYKRYLKFIDSIAASSKPALKKLLSMTKNDCTSRTGRNLRNIMLRFDAVDIDHIDHETSKKLVYVRIPENDNWKISIVKELIDNQLNVPGFSNGEIQDIKNFVCAS